jgi:hypothetical protein
VGLFAEKPLLLQDYLSSAEEHQEEQAQSGRRRLKDQVLVQVELTGHTGALLPLLGLNCDISRHEAS